MKTDIPLALRLVIIAGMFAMFSCGGKARQEDIKFRQYYLKGETLYKQNCANCHQANGQGFGLLYPPLDSSDFLRNYADSSICIIRHGRVGHIVVNGKEYNQPMPASPALTDIEIAQLMTYICNSWSNEQGMFEVKKVSEVLADCAAY